MELNVEEEEGEEEEVTNDATDLAYRVEKYDMKESKKLLMTLTS